MARTKQTAKKSVGGTAKRKLIQPSTRTLRSHGSHSYGPSHSPQLIAGIEIEMSEGADLNKLTVEVEPVENQQAGHNKGDDVGYYLQLA